MGIIKGAVKLTLLTGIITGSFYVGYKAHEFKVKSQPFYVDMSYGRANVVQTYTGRREPINENFQLGSIEHRLIGLLEEAPRELKKSLEKIGSEYSFE